VIHEPGRGYRTVVHISGRQPIAGDYPESQWSQAKADLEEALRQHRCDVFAINAPIQTEIGLSRIAQLDQRTALADQCLHSAEADVRPPRRKSGVDPYRKSAGNAAPGRVHSGHPPLADIGRSLGGSDASRVNTSVRGEVVDLAARDTDIH
jgi:hypothetical protein